MSPAIITAKPGDETLPMVDEMKLKLTIGALAEKYNQKVRELIYRAYNDPELGRIYQAIRASGIYQHGSKDKSQRKVLEFPNIYVFRFVEKVMTALYGSDWMNNKKALKHELVKPWWVINRL